eukprot:GABV01014433.1.p1 GENE.GABV01014433.1~~GABV01014433.1.p1  ORF type:complete len:108 (-),score=58.44 GABV01014433.1:3-326(-)
MEQEYTFKAIAEGPAAFLKTLPPKQRQQWMEAGVGTGDSAEVMKKLKEQEDEMNVVMGDLQSTVEELEAALKEEKEKFEELRKKHKIELDTLREELKEQYTSVALDA